MSEEQPESIAGGDGEIKVKPVLVNPKTKKAKKKKTGLKWDEAKIQEHDLLRGTRMKIDEPDTPYHQYDSGSETDGSHNANKNPDNQISWDHLQNKLDAAAAARDAYPSSPSSHGANDEEEEERRRKDIKALEFKEHRKRHYNEMELVRKFRAAHGNEMVGDEDEENDADDEN